MGRITIFAIADCPHCLRIKAIFNEKHIPYTEISLTTHPDKRVDMLQLADQLSVPQIFFNEKHVGGAEEALAILADWDLERYRTEVASQDDPTDPRLQPPTSPPISTTPSPSRPDEASIPLLDGSKTTVLQITEKLKTILPRTSFKHNLTIYKNSFTGHEAVEALQKEYNLTEGDAIVFGLQLVNANIFHHVVSDKLNDFTNATRRYFRLHCYQSPDVLNSYRVWTERVDPDPIRLIKYLKDVMSKIEASVTADGCVDYVAACNSPDYCVFEEAVCELQNIDLASMDDTTRTAFGINVYNVMIKYAFMKVGIGTTNLSRHAFFGSVRMNLGGHLYSLNELENGILRGNRKPPYSLSVPFGRNDPRLSNIIAQPDCRIHFALNCGAKSCPPVKFFTPQALNEELRIVAMAFCEQDDNVRVDADSGTLYLTMILNWYRVDFTVSNAKVPMAVIPYLRGTKQSTLQSMIDNISSQPIKVVFLEYDWSTNASAFLPFDKSILKANKMSIMNVLF